MVVVVWSKTSFWSRENMRPMRVKSLAGRLLILQLTVVAVTVAAGALITVLVARERTETAAARSLADRRAHRRRAARPRASAARRRPVRTLQPLAERRAPGRARRLHHDHAPRRHPLHAPDAEPDRQALRRHLRAGGAGPDGHRDHQGHARPLASGRSCRSRDDGRVVALVAVGVLTDAIGEEVAALLPGLIGLARRSCSRSAACSACCSPAASSARRSAWSRRRSRRSTPTTTRPCTRSARASWCSTSTAGPALVNDHAKRLLGDDDPAARRRSATTRR